MKPDYEVWQDELNGVKPRSSWPLVAGGLVLVVFAIAVLKVML